LNGRNLVAAAPRSAFRLREPLPRERAGLYVSLPEQAVETVPQVASPVDAGVDKRRLLDV